RHDGFAAGEVDTGLIARDLETLAATPAPPEHMAALAAIAGLGLLQGGGASETGDAPVDPWEALIGWRHWTDAKQYVALASAGERRERRVTVLGGGRFLVDGGAAPVEIEATASPEGGYRVATAGRRFRAEIVAEARRITVFADGVSASFELPDALAEAEADQAGGDAVVAPMPGLVKLVTASAGAAVSRGDRLLVLEAMKMEHTMRAPRDGVVAEVLAAEGDQVTDGALLLTLVPQEEGAS
ncbi:MAG: biotin/lipoyl-containing protein, partial [Pseudomonadota bacterium]